MIRRGRKRPEQRPRTRRWEIDPATWERLFGRAQPERGPDEAAEGDEEVAEEDEEEGHARPA